MIINGLIDEWIGEFIFRLIDRWCGRRQGGVRGVVGLATCRLHPQAIHGLPPINEAGLKAIKLESWLLRERAGYHKPELQICRQFDGHYDWWRIINKGIQ